MSSEFSTLALNEPANHILMITLDRVEASNAFNTLMGRELMTLFEELAMEPAKYRAIVVTGQGDKAFCAGGDLKERKGRSDEQWQAQHLVFERMIRAVIDCPIAVHRTSPVQLVKDALMNSYLPVRHSVLPRHSPGA